MGLVVIGVQNGYVFSITQTLHKPKCPNLATE
jgi:hypothetical protein